MGTGYKKGDFIGRFYEVLGILGRGGFGVVYLVYSHETKFVFALKTFLDEYLQDVETRERFRREANVWVDLERHPSLVRAYFVDEIAGRLYIAMEYIAPDEQGLKSLEDYLTRRPPDLAQSLRWAIQVCHGMEYAYSKGVRCHRDITPRNIMISQDKTVKITDFGLAGVLDTSKAASSARLSVHEGRVGLSTMGGGGFGTPTHMPPEQFTNAKDCDERSDIYAFGVVLYQMATKGKYPFLAPLPRDDSQEEQMRFWRQMHRLHSESPVPKLNSPLSVAIQRCLEKEPAKRYQTFKELRRELEPLLSRQTGEAIKPPEMKELEASEWSARGFSLNNLGRFDEAIRCYDKAIEINPRYDYAWNNKGLSLAQMGRFNEATRCFDKAIEINPRYDYAWNNKGACIGKLGRFDEAIRCYDKAIEINPTSHDAWFNKGACLSMLGRFDEAIRCYDKAIEINPQDALAWTAKGACLDMLGRFDEAIRCYDKAIEINPQDAVAWFNKAVCEDRLGRRRDAASSFRKFVALAPPQYAAQIEGARRRLQEWGE